MKKNKMMRLASLLLVMCLLTTSVISGTFAKYTYTTNGSDSARVAKWGVQGTINGGAFAKTYNLEDTVDGEFTLAVESEEKVVAPGTTGTFAGISLTGEPEVAVRITNTATLTLAGWEVEGVFYCPIVITINDENISGLDYDDADEFIADVEAAIEASSGDYAPNTDLATEVTGLNGNYTWAWAFDGDGDKDTALGNAAAGLNDGTPATIALSVVTLVEQIN